MSKHIKQLLVSVSAILMIAGVGASANNVNANANVKRHTRTHRVYRHRRRARRVRRVRSAWHYGIPAAIRGHYASYSYLRGSIRHGERTDINLNRTFVSILPKGAPDPFGLKNLHTKKIGYNKYIISGRVESVGNQGNAGLIVTKTRRGVYIRCTNNKLGTKRNVNGSYFGNRYTHAFRVLNSEV